MAVRGGVDGEDAWSGLAVFVGAREREVAAGGSVSSQGSYKALTMANAPVMKAHNQKMCVSGVAFGLEAR